MIYANIVTHKETCRQLVFTGNNLNDTLSDVASIHIDGDSGTAHIHLEYDDEVYHNEYYCDDIRDAPTTLHELLSKLEFIPVSETFFYKP